MDEVVQHHEQEQEDPDQVGEHCQLNVGDHVSSFNVIQLK